MLCGDWFLATVLQLDRLRRWILPQLETFDSEGYLKKKERAVQHPAAYMNEAIHALMSSE